MTGKKTGSEHREDTLGCPVVGDKVELSATYRRTDLGDKTLVDFGCSMEGLCGITLWDPCPMYVAYLEQKLELEDL